MTWRRRGWNKIRKRMDKVVFMEFVYNKYEKRMVKSNLVKWLKKMISHNLSMRRRGHLPKLLVIDFGVVIYVKFYVVLM